MTVDEAFVQALALSEAGRLAEAERICRQILAAQPRHAGTLYCLAGIAQKCGHADAAIDLLRQSLAIFPAAEAWTLLGSLLKERGQADEAEAAFREAVKLAPAEPITYLNLGSVLWEAKRYAEARAAYEKSVQLKADFAHGWHGVMTVAGDMGDVDVALAAGRRAAELGINTPQFWSDLGIAHHEAGDLDGALAAGERAVAMDSAFPSAHYNMAQFLLLTGNFERGWREHEWRWGIPNFPSPRRDFAQPMWDGRRAPDKTVLLHAEQGFGDTIMWGRYIPLAAERVRIIVEVQAELVSLVRTIPGAERVIARFQDPGLFDFHAPFGSLPLIFNTTVKTIPREVPYIKVDPEGTRKWTARLAEDHKFRVGIAWAGRPTHINDRNRSIALSLLAPLAEVEGVSFYSLQKGERASEAASSPLQLIDYTAELDDFADTAALLEQLDLVISVDTSIVHLAGALAKPVWVMLPFAPDWRWLLSEPQTSPWYPTMRLFRQERAGEWEGVVTRVVEDLRKAIG